MIWLRESVGFHIGSNSAWLRFTDPKRRTSTKEEYADGAWTTWSRVEVDEWWTDQGQRGTGQWQKPTTWSGDALQTPPLSRVVGDEWWTQWDQDANWKYRWASDSNESSDPHDDEDHESSDSDDDEECEDSKELSDDEFEGSDEWNKMYR